MGEIIVGSHVTEKKFGKLLFSLSKMAIRKFVVKGLIFKKNRNYEIVFCLQK
jgi:hypothetical protein